MAALHHPRGRRDGEKHPRRLARERLKPMMPIKPRRRFVLGVDHQREHCGIGADRARNGVEQQRGAELPALKAAIDGEPANQRGRQHGIARQFARLFRGQTGHRDARGGKRVVARDGAALQRRGDKTVGDMTADVLRRLRPQIAVERFCAAGKRLAVVRGGKLRDDEAGAHRVVAISRRCAVRARRNAGAGFGGVPSASASAF